MPPKPEAHAFGTKGHSIEWTAGAAAGVDYRRKRLGRRHRAKKASAATPSEYQTAM